MTLEEILEKERARRCDDGPFGIKACKERIKSEISYFGVSLYDLLGEYVRRTNADKFFNAAMVLACWELINERG